jgi:hypothetical protein
MCCAAAGNAAPADNAAAAKRDLNGVFMAANLLVSYPRRFGNAPFQQRNGTNLDELRGWRIG